MPLVIAPINQELQIIKIGTDEKTKKHLGSLGIILHATIRILSNNGGSVICMIKEGRLALDHNIATKIFVV